ncbi:MAG: hypothetical protein ACOY0T_32620 [Myxococcota bacterium]
MNGQRKRPEASGFEIPDLDLPPPKPRPSQSKLAAVHPPAAEPTRTGPARVALSELPVGPSLDLDLSSPISSARDAGSLAHEVSGRGGFEMDSNLPGIAGITVAPEGRANWPNGVTPARELFDFDSKEVRAVANYGKPSSIGPLNIFYALRVAQQRRRLARELRRYENDLARAESARDERLATMAQRLRPELEANDNFRRLLAPLAEVDSALREHGDRLKTTAEERDVELRGLDAELSQLRQKLDVDMRALEDLSTVLKQRDHNFQRLDARYKRGFIELRALEQQGASREQSQRVQEAQEALRPELEATKEAYEATREEHSLRQRALSESKQRIGELERKKRDLAARFHKQARGIDKGRRERDGRGRKLLAEVGRAVLAARGGVPVDTETLEVLRNADLDVQKALRASELRLRALDACDHAKVSTGNTWLLGIISALIAIVCYRLFA